jgi:hypothetical protein
MTNKNYFFNNQGVRSKLITPFFSYYLHNTTNVCFPRLVSSRIKRWQAESSRRPENIPVA